MAKKDLWDAAEYIEGDLGSAGDQDLRPLKGQRVSHHDK